MSARQRLRQISPQRIARVAEALRARGLPVAIKLGTDGSVILTDSDGAALSLVPKDDAADEWAKLGIQ